MPTAILSLACRYPDAPTPAALWANVCEGRRAFRAIPPERIELVRYAAAAVGEADSITPVKAGLLSDWHFDTERFLIPRSTYKVADLAHWLALDVAADAVAAAGGVERFDRRRTAVIVANTLTGEFSRAAALRLRLPFLDELLAEASAGAGLYGEVATSLRRRFATKLRERFAPPDAEMLSGGLANTIAGRIANYFNLQGGAWTVDAACASSLVALANAVDLLAFDRADAVIVGAVDLSLDPFELVGFSRNGALARDDMRVFDARSSGFWPGEGAGFAVLMRADDAIRREFPVRALLRGCGLSTDGAGGLAHPSQSGQTLALRRAYENAEIDPADVAYIEAHGTGTAVGDPTEVRALAGLRDGAAVPLLIGSIKANIGHTKAAAGFAGLIKAVGAFEAGHLPPHVSCETPHPVFDEVRGRVRPALVPEPWPSEAAAVIGVSGFGFGGVNAHVVLERAGRARRVTNMPPAPRAQDAELYAFAGASTEEICASMSRLAKRAPTLSMAEMADAAARCAAEAMGAVNAPLRAAIVAGSPEALVEGLAEASAAAAQGRCLADTAAGVFVDRPARAPRIGLLFPGQAAPVRVAAAAWARRFPELVASSERPLLKPADVIDTAIAQPAIVAASLSAWRLLQRLAITPAVVVGHSLGELTALCAAGILAEEDLAHLARARGDAMSKYGLPDGGMLRIAATSEDTRRLVAGLDLALACHNAPGETVVSGRMPSIREASRRARARGVEATPLAVSHAFHSELMAPAVPAYAAYLQGVHFLNPHLVLASSVLGRFLTPQDDVHDLLARQLVEPVLFSDALRHVAEVADLTIETGPGFGLSRLASRIGLPAFALDAYGDSLVPLLGAVAAAYVKGAPVRFDALFCDRQLRPIDLDARPLLLESPCGRRSDARTLDPLTLESDAPPDALVKLAGDNDELAQVLAAIAAETGLPAERISDNVRFLDGFHLNSFSVGRIVARAAVALGVATPATTEYANATARELALGLTAARDLGPVQPDEFKRIGGVRPWVRAYAVKWIQESAGRPMRRGTAAPVRWTAAHVNSSEADVEGLAQLDANVDADGVLVWIGAGVDETSSAPLFAACRDAWARPSIVHLAICHAGAPLAGFARSLAMEARFKSVTVVERSSASAAFTFLRDEIGNDADGFFEARLDSDGRCFTPRFRQVQPPMRARAALGPNDVIMVTGGGKGITAECALRLAARCGASLILVGRSDSGDLAVAMTLERAAAAGIACRYVQADAVDAEALAAAVAEAADGLGPVTALVHAAGANQPAAFASLSDEDLHAVLAPKTAGLRAAVAAAGASLRRIVAFGSILANMGLKGETHYALANAWQTAIAETIARENADCDVLSLEWSIWNGAGMGERLGSIDRLARFGVDAIALEDGIAEFERLALGGAVGAFMVTSRFGPPREVTLDPVELPILRFVDDPKVFFPGVELVVETTLSLGRDPYLADHCIDGVCVVPGVIALEAMTQVASALACEASVKSVEGVCFHRAITLAHDREARVRIVTLSRRDGLIDAIIRVADDGYATDRVCASFRFGSPATARADEPQRGDLDLDAKPLYGRLFFQSGRFARVARYTAVSARAIAAEIAPPAHDSWFGPLQPPGLTLGDPGARDAMLHALQAAVPHRAVVPVEVESIRFETGGSVVFVEARERNASAEFFVFDIVGRDASGAAVETWTAATFRSIAPTPISGSISLDSPLAPPFVERIARAALEDSSIIVAIVVDQEANRDRRRQRAFAAIGIDNPARRCDGKPLPNTKGTQFASIAHVGAFTLAVVAAREIGCDLAVIETLPGPPPAGAPPWLEYAAGDDPEPVRSARLWAAGEVATKCGRQLVEAVATSLPEDPTLVTFKTPFGRVVTIRITTPAGEAIAAIGVLLENKIVESTNVEAVK